MQLPSSIGVAAANSVAITAGVSTPGDYINGNIATGVSPTIVDQSDLNMLSHELNNVVTGFGYTPSSTNSTQVYWAIANRTRNKLQGAATFYVSTTGNDTTGSGTSASPWATLQHAYNVVAGYDLNGYTAQISVAAGTYTSPVYANLNTIQTGNVQFIGNNSNPNAWTANSTVFLNCTNTNAFVNQSGSTMTITGFKIATSGTSSVSSTIGFGVFAGVGSTIVQNCQFHTCGSGHMAGANNGLLTAYNTNILISGSAPIHVLASDGIVNYTFNTATFNGSPAFSTGYAVAQYAGFLTINNNTWSGAASGPYRYWAIYGGTCATNAAGASYIGGSSYTASTSNGTTGTAGVSNGFYI